jgi:hypothetical protein
MRALPVIVHHGDVLSFLIPCRFFLVLLCNYRAAAYRVPCCLGPGFLAR